MFFLLSGFAQNNLNPKNTAFKIIISTNLTGVSIRSNDLTLQIPGEAVYKLFDGTKGSYLRGLMGEYVGVMDMRNWFGVLLDIYLENDDLFNARLTLRIPLQKERLNLPDSTSAIVNLQGKGWHTITVPFSTFDYDRGQVYSLKFGKLLAVTGQYSTLKGKINIGLRNLKLVKCDQVHLEASVNSKPCYPDSTMQYSVFVGNSSDSNQLINLSITEKGLEGMNARIVPNFVSLIPGEEKQVTVSNTVPVKCPQGAQESQILTANSTVGTINQIEFITVCRLSSQYLVHSESGWQDVKTSHN